jgi:hypothetical protein
VGKGAGSKAAQASALQQAAQKAVGGGAFRHEPQDESSSDSDPSDSDSDADDFSPQKSLSSLPKAHSPARPQQPVAERSQSGGGKGLLGKGPGMGGAGGGGAGKGLSQASRPEVLPQRKVESPPEEPAEKPTILPTNVERKPVKIENTNAWASLAESNDEEPQTSGHGLDGGSLWSQFQERDILNKQREEEKKREEERERERQIAEEQRQQREREERERLRAERALQEQAQAHRQAEEERRNIEVMHKSVISS